MNISHPPYRASPRMSSFYDKSTTSSTDFGYHIPFEMSSTVTTTTTAASVRAAVYNNSQPPSQMLVHHSDQQRLLHSGFAAISENLFLDQEVFPENNHNNITNNNVANVVNNNLVINCEPSFDNDYKNYQYPTTANANFKLETVHDGYPGIDHSQLNSNQSYYHHMLPQQLQHTHNQQRFAQPQRPHEITPSASRIPLKHHQPRSHHYQHHHHQHHQHQHHQYNMPSNDSLRGSSQHPSYNQHFQRHHQQLHAMARNEPSATNKSDLWLDTQMEEVEERKSNALGLSNRY